MASPAWAALAAGHVRSAVSAAVRAGRAHPRHAAAAQVAQCTGYVAADMVLPAVPGSLCEVQAVRADPAVLAAVHAAASAHTAWAAGRETAGAAGREAGSAAG